MQALSLPPCLEGLCSRAKYVLICGQTCLFSGSTNHLSQVHTKFLLIQPSGLNKTATGRSPQQKISPLLQIRYERLCGSLSLGSARPRSQNVLLRPTPRAQSWDVPRCSIVFLPEYTDQYLQPLAASADQMLGFQHVPSNDRLLSDRLLYTLAEKVNQFPLNCPILGQCVPTLSSERCTRIMHLQKQVQNVTCNVFDRYLGGQIMP